jgi:tryptophan synthase alpha chain
MAQVNRIDETFQRLRSIRRKAFVTYLTAGDPDLARTPGLVWALERAGADIVELGVPFSDPLADGLVNQLSAQRALEAGATPEGVLAAIRIIREKSQIPIVLYTYFNLIAFVGVQRYFDDAHAAGVDGILMLDLPPEEAASQGEEHGNPAVKRIRLIAPTTPEERIGRIARLGSGFLYYVSREGVTGMQASVASTLQERVALIKKYTELPVCVGFGISNAEQAATVAKLADGVVVGSALVSRVAEWAQASDLAARLEAFARPLAEATHAI